jgi:hypothetical protein
MLAIAVMLVALAVAGHSQHPPGSKAARRKATVSEDPREIVNIALGLARSPNPDDHQNLLRQLSSSAFLMRLDSPEEYRQTGRRLRVARVLEALATNPAPSARNVLVSLTESREFIDEPRRVDFLIRYSAEVRPAPPPLIAFWDRYSQPLDGFSHLTIEALTTNGSEPALALLEQKLADRGHPDDDKQYWMRSYLLPRRNDVLLLQTVERLLTRTLPAHLRPDLVEAIFDYQPDQWYSEATVVLTPNRLEASLEAKDLLRRIGQIALSSITLTPAQQEAVKKALDEIGPA